MRVPAILRLAEAPAIHDLDCPSTAAVHHRIIRSKPFLESVYRSFYREVVRNLPTPRTGTIVEIGSGAGFFNDILPDVVTSDVMPIDNIDVCFSGHAMPLHDGSVDALVLVNVFHHIPDTLAFLREASRCLVPGGRLIMVEPANTPWSRFVFRTFHHEAFDPHAGWGLSTSRASFVGQWRVAVDCLRARPARTSRSGVPVPSRGVDRLPFTISLSDQRRLDTQTTGALFVVSRVHVSRVGVEHRSCACLGCS